MPTCNLIMHCNILIMRDSSPEGPVCAHLSHCSCVCVYLGSVALMSLKSSLKYCGARTMTDSEEEMDRAGSDLVSTTAFTKPSQSNCRQKGIYRNKNIYLKASVLMFSFFPDRKKMLHLISELINTNLWYFTDPHLEEYLIYDVMMFIGFMHVE